MRGTRFVLPGVKLCLIYIHYNTTSILPFPCCKNNPYKVSFSQYTLYIIQVPLHRTKKQHIMRKIIVTSFVTLDGVLQAPGAPSEDTTQGFKWGGWSARYGDDQTNETIGGIMSGAFDLLLGRRTYEIFSAYWPYQENHPVAEKFNAVQKFVVSGKQPPLEWVNSTLISGDVAAGIRALKQQDGPDLHVWGSSRLIQTLLANNLVDKLYVLTYPVTVGKGKRLFDGGSKAESWKLVSAKVSGKGVIIGEYEPAGELVTGTVGGETTPSEAELTRRKRWAQEG
jgi:Dihydrofolate reductase